MKINTSNSVENKPITTVERKVILDQIAKQNHSNQEMIQGGIMAITTKIDSLMANAIIVKREVIDKSNVKLRLII